MTLENSDHRRACYRVIGRGESDVERGKAVGNLAAIAAASGNNSAALLGFRHALEVNPRCKIARDNLEALGGSFASHRERRIAIVSLLFNWPSTGGGTIHTKELAEFLQFAGYEVRHIFAVFPKWGLGRVTESLPYPHRPVVFHGSDWCEETIQDWFRDAVEEFAPDAAIITDSWNFKPLLAEVVADIPYFLRLAAMECLCPLNNVRLLFNEGRVVQCDRHQLADAGTCRSCVQQRSRYSGSLHQAERSLSGFETAEYAERLHAAFRNAEAVLTVNPLVAEMARPYCKKVAVLPSGFDASRFQWKDAAQPASRAGLAGRLIFAGLVDEAMKGFHVLFEACSQLWKTRRDFELIVTADAGDEWQAPFVRWVGWQSQDQLPEQIRAADILIFPTIAQEALGRTAVEAMGCGRPVIASRLGGLPFVVEDQVTGLLFEPGNHSDLAAKIDRLLNNPQLRRQMGQAGRREFERRFTWDVIIPQYESLLGSPTFVEEPLVMPQ